MRTLARRFSTFHEGLDHSRELLLLQTPVECGGGDAAVGLDGVVGEGARQHVLVGLRGRQIATFCWAAVRDWMNARLAATSSWQTVTVSASICIDVGSDPQKQGLSTTW
jgi:hypothetical protein